jgi:anti-sigma regulatory factor (Ser/Thr protein kinase)
LEVSIHNQASEITLAHQALDELAARHALPARPVSRVHLALEEHLTNVMTHGYADGKPATITIRYTVDRTMLRVEIEDDAAPFDPTIAPRTDISIPLDERPLGGLGLHMIRQSVDEWEYRRERGRNVLVFKQHLS